MTARPRTKTGRIGELMFTDDAGGTYALADHDERAQVKRTS